jgi:hypothetical protein
MMEGVNSSMVYLIYVRTFAIVTMYPQYNNFKKYCNLHRSNILGNSSLKAILHSWKDHRD